MKNAMPRKTERVSRTQCHITRVVGGNGRVDHSKRLREAKTISDQRASVLTLA
jgi:hypothetical protein